MKEDVLRRAQAKKMQNRRRGDMKKVAEPSVPKEVLVARIDEHPEADLEPVMEEASGDKDANASGKGSGRGRGKAEGSSKKAKRANEAAMHQQLVDMVIEKSDLLLARQRGQNLFVTPPILDAPSDISSNAVALRGPSVRFDRATAARRLLTVPKPQHGQTLKDNPDGWTECIIRDPRIRKLLESVTPAHVPRPPQQRYKIRSSSIAGTGMFATRDLKPNDLIHSERPLLIASTKPWLDVVNPPGMSKDHLYHVTIMHLEETLGMAWCRMQPETKDAYLALSNSCPKLGPFMGVKKTNEKPLFFEGEKEPYSATYNRLSRLNHSCLPNAAIHFNMKTFAGELRTLRDVGAGEEILISYFPTAEPLATRESILQKCGFTCQCRMCTDPATEALRQRIVDSEKQLKGYLSTSEGAKKQMDKKEHEKILKESTTWVEIIEKEGMQGLSKAYMKHLQAMGSALLNLGRIVDALNVGAKMAQISEANAGDDNGIGTSLQGISKKMANGADPRTAAFINRLAKEYSRLG